MTKNGTKFFNRYSLEEIPWHFDEPDDSLKSLIEEKSKLGLALDVCSGAESNTIFLARKRFYVTAVDISDI